MGFWSGLKNFGSKILHGVTSAAKWVAPVLHKVMGAVSGPLGAINPTAELWFKNIKWGKLGLGICSKYFSQIVNFNIDEK
ncbi:MAG: hypothetical protein EZS28_002502 [Streblomastix strix]|uniref:Uncharacterized protein n=1 Tax=Streblomastix strix TaxID=222440 RepID=A0A5J4X4Q9_9EUKA|nr:MAG: hypothetical protein EZS28_002502 [Streblomastix strix]